MRRAAMSALLLLAPGVVEGAEEGAVPLIVAVDESRSLSATALDEARRRLATILAGLPADTPAALLAFADDARWVRPLGTPLSELPAALDELRPTGRFTLLNDALFTAARELEPTGGVILLVTDGRDENSATTVEDVARRAEGQGVIVLTTGLGARIEALALRRLALLTGGTYLGALASLDAAAVAGTIEGARATVAANRPSRAAAASAVAPAAQPAQPELATPPPAAVAEPVRNTSASLPWPLLLLGFGLLAAALILVLAFRRRPAALPNDRETELEHELRLAEERELQLALRDRPVASPDETAEIAIPRDLRDDIPADEDDSPLEKTRVLAQRSLLMVKEPGAAIRSLMLKGDRAFGVGRDGHGNTLRIIDPALSGHHFKIVPDGETYVLVDLGSTNGCYVNRERVRARRLSSGDVIHAGQVEFEFRSFEQPLN